ncbi:unnamed protein product [Alopecurus aequalis]
MVSAPMDGELGSVLKVSVAVWVAMWYARMAAVRISPGVGRLAALLPAIGLFFGTPFAFTTTAFRGCSGFILSWLGSFKLFLLAAGRGPLDPSLPLLHFVCSASLPVKLRQSAYRKAKNQDPASPPSAAKILVAGAVIPFTIYTYQFKEAMSRWQLLLVTTAHFYLAMEVILASVRAMIEGVLGMEMDPQVDRPYLASSLRDFWGRRWNLMVPAILRPSVYGPVRARFGAGAGVLASFVVSGLMHDLIYYYMMRRPPSGAITAFFVLHGACTVAEAWWRRHAGWWRPPRVVAVPLTLAFVAATGLWLFIPAMWMDGLHELVLQDFQGMVGLMEQAGRWLAGAATNLRRGHWIVL